MRKKKKDNLGRRVLNQIFSIRGVYILIVISLITLYPVYVSDGQKWTYIESFGIKLPLRYTIHGIDVSHHNNEIDWHKVKHSTDDNVEISFCFIKATEGEDLKDQDFSKNWREAKKTGLIRGAYHFYVPSANPVEQAQNFIESVNLKEGDFVPVLDFEVQGSSKRVRAKLFENVKTFINLIENHYGVKPIIYTNGHIYRQYIKGNFDSYPLWIADYQSQKLEGYSDSKLMFWQHSTDGTVDGISGNVDFNVFVASKSHLEDICIKSTH
ncbi:MULTISPECIES: glycoside hydrolase family 25 protein [Emticicia]|uniref:glycoside hydrolase family 25 protein n=1 Tax=Emticicia TaxID=312278 RepID=UPI0009ED7EA1|nr:MULTISPECIES: GH25 family lysozyme [Emticicia]